MDKGWRGREDVGRMCGNGETFLVKFRCSICREYNIEVYFFI
jgi:hypothetical protein